MRSPDADVRQDGGEREQELRKRLAVTSLLLAAAASVFLLVVPTASEVSGNCFPAVAPSAARSSPSTSVPGCTESQERRVSLLEHEGWRILPILAIPVLLAGVGAVATVSRFSRAAAALSALLLLAFVALGLISIGLFYVPAALVMLVAALTGGGRPGPMGRAATGYASTG